MHNKQFNKGLIDLISMVPPLDPVSAKCIISSLIKDLSTFICMVPALDPVPAKMYNWQFNKGFIKLNNNKKCLVKV